MFKNWRKLKKSAKLIIRFEILDIFGGPTVLLAAYCLTIHHFIRVFLETYLGELSSLPPLLPVDGERVVAEEEEEDE